MYIPNQLAYSNLTVPLGVRDPRALRKRQDRESDATGEEHAPIEGLLTLSILEKEVFFGLAHAFDVLRVIHDLFGAAQRA